MMVLNSEEERENTESGKLMMMEDKKRGMSKDSAFTDLVFSWSLQHILDETLYSNQVETIPEKFESVEHYLGSYVFPLLEETRAELASSMEIIDEAPYAEVISFDESKLRGKLLYDVKVECWKNRFSDRGKEPYRTLPGDILVFSDAKPESISDFQRVGRTWTFASVTSIKEDENEDHSSSSTYFKVEAPLDIEVKAMLGKFLFVVFLTNITTNRRIWKSLHVLRNSRIIKEVLCTDSVVQEKCDLCSECGDSQLLERFGNGLFSKLNESQAAAIISSLLKVKCNHKPSVELIWGPPGTGKTTTVGVMLCALLKMNCRTLACAPTDVAITQVASRVANLVKESFEAESSKDGLFLGDVLLFGNKNRLRVGSDIEGIYLDYRVERLTEFLGPLTGWRHCLASMIDFLEDCVSQYHIFLENESMKQKEQSNRGDVGRAELKSFLEYARDRFKSILLPLRKCVYTFCTHLPRTFILKHENFQNMVYLTSLLDSLETFLFDDNLGSEELEDLFSQNSKSYVDSSSLPMWRTKCLSVLQTLRYSLEELDLPSVMNKGSIRDFCFQMASLIFCTASSSYKLHSIEMEPLNLLVIDEAAQLKECESTIPLQISGMRHAILVGDECQLPAMVSSKVSSDAGFGRSLFERLSLLGHSKHLLNMQYRMHPSISCFPNSEFYRSQLFDAPNVGGKSYERHYLPGPMFGPYSFINVAGGKEEQDDVRHSRRNMIEVALVMKILHNLYKAWSRSKWKLSIGIISPYAAQVVAIQDKLPQKYENIDGFSMKVKSIDGFQGGEEDIIIISTVRSNSGGSIGFVSSPQRTNVALTRARHCLWILGNEKTLANSESVWQALVRDAKDRQCFFNADEDNDMAKTIIDAKKELNQFEDLLSGDSVLFSKARWKVLFSENFRKSFGKLKSVSTKKSVMNLLLKLCNGWRPKNRKVDLVCENSSQILKQFKVEGLYVVSTIDIIKESGHKQVLKVWDILPLEEIPKLEKRLDSIFVMYTDDYISRCKVKCLEGDLEVPKSWVTSHDIVRLKIVTSNEEGSQSSDVAVDGRNFVENSKVSESLLLMKFYSLSPGVVNHLLYDRDGAELDLPFEVTDEELEIILFSRSTFILGRSGTGKTTVLTMKLFQKEKHHHIASEGYYAVGSSTTTGASARNEVGECIGETGRRTVLRQLFVTVSPRLCFAVKQHVSQLKSFAQGGKYSAENRSTDIDDMDQFKDIPDSFVGITPNKFPLVITFHKFLMMLDGTLGSSFFDRFSAAKVSHGTTRSSRSVALETFIRNKEVNYDRFCSIYWPRFNTRLTKTLDPSRVFTEIISHIKCGVQAGEDRDPKLSKEDYVLLSEGRVSSLSRKKREILYDIFSVYEKMKIENGDFDLADLVIDLHIRLRNERFEGDEIDFVYIDEVQDLTMGQIALFKYICRNVEEGFVFSGDTAQTIARGIDFRFEDIRSLFYNEFILASRGDGTSRRKEKGILSEIFNLNQNFRTHEGVLKLAQSIVELLYRFFPQFVDVLKPETSLIYGEAPILLESGNDENAIVTFFGSSGNACGDIVGFGAEQVILVRDESARMEISDFVGKHALVLTIVECKGLEFQDVLLYNFFGSSPLKYQWRVIYEYMKEQELLDSTSPSTKFKEERHDVMCSELKQLYVAITRTRQRLWICENVEELSKPMFDYWKKKCLVQVRKLDDSLAQAMQVASSPEEWKARGVKLFWENNYEMATMCFERAGDITWEKRAKATGLKAAADRLRVSNPEMASTVLREAAEIFNSIGRSEAAAECFCDLGEYERAGHIYLEQCGEFELKKAGECFSLAERYELAAKVYAKGNYFSECLSVCAKGKLFDMGLQYINCWKENSEKSKLIGKTSNEIHKVEQEFLESCANSYYKLKDNKSMMKFVRAFHLMDLRRNFLKSLDCLDELLVLEKESGNFLEAAEIAKLRGDILLEADLRGLAGHFSEASLLVLWYVFQNSLWVSGNRGFPMKTFPRKDELLTKAKLFAENDSDLFNVFVCNEVRILSNEQSSLFELNQLFNSSKQQTSMRGKILSVWKILDAHLHSKTSKYEWEDELVMEQTKRSEERISKECVSVETLVFFWNLWKDSIVKMLEYLESIETQEGGSKYLGHGEFCLNYFGIRRQFNNFNFNYLLINSEADWVRGIDDRFLKRKGRLVSADPRHFVSAARSHCRDVLLEVSVKVLETLEALYKFSIRNSLSVFCQSTCLIHIFEVSNFLVEFKFRTKTLQNFLDLSTEYFKNVFPLDRQMSLRENMIPLRGTEISRKLLEEVIRGNLGGTVSYGQIGKVVMVLLGSGKPSNELREEIVKRFNCYPSWKAFIGNLSVGGNIPEFSQGFLFLKALEDTYNANWSKENDYIDPFCFLYLIERLLIMVSYFRGFFFTTKSSFVEWVFFQESNANLNDGLVTDYGTVFDFVAKIVKQFLYEKHDTIQWIEMCGINVNYYYPLLVLRLFVILCLLCLSSGNYSHLLYDLLGMDYITSKLPREFLDVLRRRRRRQRNYVDINVNVLAEAFKKIGDPLVIVSLGKECSKYTSKDSIFVNMGVSQCREDILRLLFPRNLRAPQELTYSCSGEVPLKSEDQGKFSKVTSSNLVSVDRQNVHTNTGNGGGNLQIEWGLFREFCDALVSVEKRKDGSLMTFKYSNAVRLKVEVEKITKMLADAMTTRKNSWDAEDGNFCGEASNMLDELKHLSSALDMSDKELEQNISRSVEILRDLQLRGPKLESFLNQLYIDIVNTNDVGETSETHSDMGADRK